MILLDTNILSELMRPLPTAVVEEWLGAQMSASLFISAVTEAELRFGVALLADGKRRSRLAEELDKMLAEDFAERILPFDSAAAISYARVASQRRKAGRPIAQADAQIVAIALSRGAALATRNVTDFADCGVDLINPWRDK
jgi:predicted nucleic acid-binding protein